MKLKVILTFKEVFGEAIGDTSSIFLGCNSNTLSLGMYPWIPMTLESSSIFIGPLGIFGEEFFGEDIGDNSCIFLVSCSIIIGLGRVVALGLGIIFGEEFFGEDIGDN